MACNWRHLMLLATTALLLAGCVTTTPPTAVHQPMTVRPEARQMPVPRSEERRVGKEV